MFGGSTKASLEQTGPGPGPSPELDLTATGAGPVNFLTRRIRLSQSQLANIGFVVLACLGALLCAVIFFNKRDFLRSAPGPHELFYDVPPADHKRPGKRGPGQSGAADPHPLERKSSASSDRAGDPFARSAPFLNLGRPLFPGSRSRNGRIPGPTAIQPTPESLLSRLTLVPIEGDALTKALNQNAVQPGRSGEVHAHVALPATTAEDSRLRLQPRGEGESRLSSAKENAAHVESGKSQPGKKGAQVGQKQRRVQKLGTTGVKAAKPARRMTLEERHRASLLSDVPSNNSAVDGMARPATGPNAITKGGQATGTLHGVSHPISFPAAGLGGGHR